MGVCRLGQCLGLFAWVPPTIPKLIVRYGARHYLAGGLSAVTVSVQLCRSLAVCGNDSCFSLNLSVFLMSWPASQCISISTAHTAQKTV